jgi:hypothetical protein
LPRKWCSGAIRDTRARQRDKTSGTTCSRWKDLRLDDFAAAQAGGADADALALSVDLGMDGLQVQIPAPLAHVMGVADAVSSLRLAAADFTLLCHFLLQKRLLSMTAQIRFEG